MAITTPKTVFSDLEKKKLSSAYVLFGDEPFKVQEFLSKFTEALNLKASTQEKFNGQAHSCPEIVEALGTRSLFSLPTEEQKLVVVSDAGSLKETEVLQHFLEEQISQKDIPLDAILVLVFENLDGRKKFHQWLKKQMPCLEFKQAKDSELLSWVQYLAKKQKLKLSPEAASFLATCSENSLFRLSHEMDKLASYLGESAVEAEVPLAVVTQVCSNHSTPEFIELVKAILERKKTRSLLLCEKLIRSSEEALSLVGFLVWSLKNGTSGFGGRQALSSNSSEVQSFWIPPLLKLDEELKTTGMEPKLLIERFVLETASSH